MFKLTTLSQVVHDATVPVLLEAKLPATLCAKDKRAEQGKYGRVYDIRFNATNDLHLQGGFSLFPETGYVLKEFRSMDGHRTGRFHFPLSRDFKAEVNLMSQLGGKNVRRLGTGLCVLLGNRTIGLVLQKYGPTLNKMLQYTYIHNRTRLQ